MKPVIINVFGDKRKKKEPEQHRICFPGGEIHVDRTTDGEYWAHIYVNTAARHKHINGDFKDSVLASKQGTIVSSRIDFDHDEYDRRYQAGERTIEKLPNESSIQHIAVRLAFVDS